MAAAAERTRIAISLELACGQAGCAELALDLYRLLDRSSYSLGASVMAVPARMGAWEAAHRTARKRAARAARLGYRFAEIDRSLLADDIYEINTSLPNRQGRPMTAGYQERQEYAPLPAYTCGRHRIHTYGVLEHDRLRAYLVLYRAGELALVSQILGHGDHLAGDVMYLLAAGTIRAQFDHGGWLYYNRHDSGTDGLRYYKERLGFQPCDIEIRP